MFAALQYSFLHQQVDAQGGSSLLTIAHMARSCAQSAAYFELLQRLFDTELKLQQPIIKQLHAAVHSSRLDDLCRNRLIESAMKPRAEFMASWQMLTQSISTPGKPSDVGLLLRPMLSRALLSATERIISTASFTEQQAAAVLPCLQGCMSKQDAKACVDVVLPAFAFVIKSLPRARFRIGMPEGVLNVLSALVVHEDGKRTLERCAADIQTWLAECMQRWWSSNQVPEINALLSLRLPSPLDQYVTTAAHAFLQPMDGPAVLDQLVRSPTFQTVLPVRGRLM